MHSTVAGASVAYRPCRALVVGIASDRIVDEHVRRIVYARQTHSVWRTKRAVDNDEKKVEKTIFYEPSRYGDKHVVAGHRLRDVF